MFKKIWNKIKSAGKWIVEKIKAAGRKVKNFITEHPEEIKTAVKVAGAAVFVVGFIKGFSNSIKDYTPPTREEKARHAEEEIRKAWGVYERYKDVDAAPAKRVYYDDHAPINEYSDFTGNQLNVLEFDKGFWASLEGDFGGDKNLTLGQLGDTGEILKQSINPMGYDLTDTNLIDNVFVVIAKDKLVKEGDNG